MLIQNKDDLKKAFELNLIVGASTDNGGIYLISSEVCFDQNFLNELLPTVATTVAQND